ncbi:unnamed protein product [marine sediment metagenome]|uniref:Uncharacterized protein n=1 Tax=marine sediment metagenome TaxID=412755 RepID=X1TT02_9ZZZZ
MKVRVNCPIAGCGIQVNVKHLEKHLENVHKLDGELVLKLHPGTAYQHTPENDQEPGEEPKPEPAPPGPLPIEDMSSWEDGVYPRTEQVAEEGGAPLETRIFSRVERTAAGESLITYKVEHAAHGSPIVWAPLIVLIAANWKAILIVMGLAALAATIVAFTIKGVSIVWKAGDKIEDLIEEAPPALVGLGVGLFIILILFALGGRKKPEAA